MSIAAADPKFDYGKFPTRDANGHLRNFIEPVGHAAYMAAELVRPGTVCRYCLRTGRELPLGIFWADSNHTQCVRCIMEHEEQDRAKVRAERTSRRNELPLPMPPKPKAKPTPSAPTHLLMIEKGRLARVPVARSVYHSDKEAQLLLEAQRLHDARRQLKAQARNSYNARQTARRRRSVKEGHL